MQCPLARSCSSCRPSLPNIVPSKSRWPTGLQAFPAGPLFNMALPPRNIPRARTATPSPHPPPSFISPAQLARLVPLNSHAATIDLVYRASYIYVLIAFCLFYLGFISDSVGFLVTAMGKRRMGGCSDGLTKHHGMEPRWEFLCSIFRSCFGI